MEKGQARFARFAGLRTQRRLFVQQYVVQLQVPVAYACCKYGQVGSEEGVGEFLHVPGRMYACAHVRARERTCAYVRERVVC